MQDFRKSSKSKKIKKNLRELAPTARSKTSKCDASELLQKLLRNIDPKKSTGIDKISPKLVQFSAEVLSMPSVHAYQKENFQVM